MKKTITYNGFGFPVVLTDCPHKEIDGSWEPDIPYLSIEALLFHRIPLKPTELCGAEIKFVRHHMDMTHKQFAKWVGFSVQEYEKTDLESANMEAKELLLRKKLRTLHSEDID